MTEDFNINLSLEWFDVSLSNKRLEIFQKNSTNCLLYFDFKDGRCNMLHKELDLIYFNSPSIHTEIDPTIRIFYQFLAVLRNRAEHYVKH